jgi:ferredoxin
MAMQRFADVHVERCPQNHPCPAVSQCPVEALSQKDVAAPTVDLETCVGCGICADFCPMGALYVKEIRDNG